MSKKTKKRKAKIVKRKRESSEIKSKYPFAIYRTKESRTVAFPFGNLTIPQNEILFCSHEIPVEKELHLPLNKAFKLLNGNSNIDLNNKKLLITRYGGIGDIICSLFGIYELKNKFNNLQIGYIASPSYSEILKAFPSLINVVINPIESYNYLRNFDYICVLDNSVEQSQHAENKTLHEIYANEMNVKLDNPKKTLDELNSINYGIDNRTHNLINGIGIHYSSGSPIRNYNLDNFIVLINKIVEKYPDLEIHLLGQPDDYVNINYIQANCIRPDNLIPNGCGFRKLTLLESMYLISKLKCVIGIDSSMLHIAGLCKTPQIGLFGPFPSKLRISYYNGIGIDGTSNCSPCFRHWPTNFCLYSGNEGECINSISPELILENIGSIINHE